MRVIPKKQLGQHFLVDENILGVIGRLADLQPDDVILEIGPGLGMLTWYLAEHAAHVHAVELDRSLEPRLRDIQKTTLHWQDALTVVPEMLDPTPTKLVSNLPYSVATPIVVESLDRFPEIGFWCVMVQREVADRFFAPPSTKAYGAVSVLVQLVTERTGFHGVSREVFRPKPNVASALVGFRRTAPGIPPGVKQLVEGAFAHRRKTLINSVALSGVATREGAAASLEQIGRGANARAEELTPPEFVALTNGLR